MESIYSSHKEVKEVLRSYLKNQRAKAKEGNQKDSRMMQEVIFTEGRKGYLKGEYVDRLVLFLRGTGCSLAKETGGCTFCGFYNATNFGEKIPDESYLAQLENVISEQVLHFERYPIICLYNDGSMLREEEISFSAVLKILEILDQIGSVQKIVVESRVADITEEKIRRIREITQKDIEIAVGFESANPLIRDLCVNKSFENSVFEDVFQLTASYNISLIPLLMVKPPFLNEREAIEDYMNSLRYLEQFDLERIDMELPTVETNTLVYDLWCNGTYRPVWLWSVIQILRMRHELGLKIPLYISPMVYSVAALAKASNCPECDPVIYETFEVYNVKGDVSIFTGIECGCKEEWLHDLNSKSLAGEIPERIVTTLGELK